MNEHLNYEDLKDRLEEYDGQSMNVEAFCNVFPEVIYWKIGDKTGDNVIVDIYKFTINLSGIVQTYQIRSEDSNFGFGMEAIVSVGSPSFDDELDAMGAALKSMSEQVLEKKF